MPFEGYRSGLEIIRLFACIARSCASGRKYRLCFIVVFPTFFCRVFPCASSVNFFTTLIFRLIYDVMFHLV